MNRMLNLFYVCLFTSCASQQPVEKLGAESVVILNTLNTPNECTQEVTLFHDQASFDQFQRSIPKEGPRSGPLFRIDFNTHTVAIICHEGIDGYEVDHLSLSKKSNQLILKKVEGYEGSSSNLILVDIPKKIKQLTLVD